MPALITDPDEIRELYDFIRQKPLNYPGYLIWVEKCYRELQLGYKKGLVFRLNGRIVGDMVVQPHKQDKGCLEIKNGRVEEGFEGHGIFTAMYLEVERYARENGFKRIVCDTHAGNTALISRFLKLGFQVEAKEDLYKRGLEVIMAKELD